MDPKRFFQTQFPNCDVRIEGSESDFTVFVKGIEVLTYDDIRNLSDARYTVFDFFFNCAEKTLIMHVQREVDIS
ncbi:MAG: hypothetical protein GXO25_05940 [Euryarchaeota archaeon]|nr:hypothetical protein [Euryarchaeota archaeon]